MSMVREKLLPGHDGKDLLVRDWESEGEGEPRGRVVLIHGIGEHSGRYRHVAAAFVAAGYAVRAYDQRGHGRSGGWRGHVDGFRQYLCDLDQVIWDLGAEDAGPLFLFGHSMGGLITLRYLQTRWETPLAGAVISNPCLEFVTQPPAFKLLGCRVLSCVAPRLGLGSDLDASLICRDPQVVADYQADPLVHGKVSARWVMSLLAAMDAARQAPDRVRRQTLWLLGGKDRICSLEGSRRFISRLPADEPTVREWPEAFHEVHNGPDKEDLLSEVVSWFAERSGNPVVGSPSSSATESE